MDSTTDTTVKAITGSGVFDKLVQMGLDRLLWVIVILLVGLLCTHLIMKLVKRGLEHFPAIDRSLHTILRAFIKIILYFLTITVAASYAGIPVSSFLALFSVVGLAISLAVQGVLTNLAGGIIILYTKMFKLEDYIATDNDVEGTVKEIGILHTKLLTFDGKLIYVPNSLLHSTKLVNYTVNNQRRVQIQISASYNNSPEEVRTAVLSTVARFPQIMQDPAPALKLTKYGDSAIEYSLRVWVNTPDYWDVYYGLNEAMYDAFKKNNVEMTYPHLNVHMN